MEQTRRAKMHLQCVFILLVLSVVSESCDMETHYMKDDKCCKMCEPGKKMKYSYCEEPMCEECEEGEYQDRYNNVSQCKRQPPCDPNLNLEKQSQSKTKYTPCKCINDHHCVNEECVSCVRNTVCSAGKRITRNGTQMSDTECEDCPIGTFSNQESSLTCQPWTECSFGSAEADPGSSTSDRTCEANRKVTIVIPVVVIVLFLALVGFFAYLMYRKDRTGSISFVRKLQTCSIWGTRHILTPTEDNSHLENGPEEEPRNQPQEDTEDLLKLEASLAPGISENGMPVIQDHSKSFLVSETETEPESFSVHL